MPQFWRGGRRFFPADREGFLKDTGQKLPGGRGEVGESAGEWVTGTQPDVALRGETGGRRKGRRRQGTGATRRRLTRKRGVLAGVACRVHIVAGKGERAAPVPRMAPQSGPHMARNGRAEGYGPERPALSGRGIGREFRAILRIFDSRTRQVPGTGLPGQRRKVARERAPCAPKTQKNAGCGTAFRHFVPRGASRPVAAAKRRPGRGVRGGRKARKASLRHEPPRRPGRVPENPSVGGRATRDCPQFLPLPSLMTTKKRRHLRVGVFHGRSRKRRYPFAAARAPEPLRGRASPGTVIY